jgi:desulfoferrodoxin-like iron-binding protein
MKEARMANVKKKGEVYRCEICGNVVEVKEAGGGELICCGQPMMLME